MPETLLSLNKSNKLRIPFVQGKFNMGGTGVLKFCGRNNLQLILSRRNPTIAERDLRDDSDLQWGFTIVRRQEPEGTRRSSVFTYLAPMNADTNPGNGGVSRFSADCLPLFPDGNSPYARTAQWGTLIKLYEYHAVGAKGHLLMPDGMLGRMDLLLPEAALPVRLHECRAGFKGHEGSWANNLTGLMVRLNDDRAENLEFPPLQSPLKAAGEEMKATIFAFKKGKAKAYRKSEGIIFILNGQTHGHFTKDFFTRRSAGRLDYIAESILLMVDCSGFSGRAREDFIMNSRDRLSGGTLREEIERALEDLLKNCEPLNELRARRQREATEAKLDDSKPLEQVLRDVLKQSPMLSQLFLRGTRLSDPFKHDKGTIRTRPFEGKAHPTFFRFREKDYGTPIHRNTPANMRSRLFFETDAVDDYFTRDVNAGTFEILLIQDGNRVAVESYVGPYLHDGSATVSMKLPSSAQPGDTFHFVTLSSDSILDAVFENRFSVTVRDAVTPAPPGVPGRKKTDRGGTDEDDAPAGIALPNIVLVNETQWSEHDPPFDKYTALRIMPSSHETIDHQQEDVYDFFVNMDNLYLQSELKVAGDDVSLLKAQFKYGMVLVGLGLVHQHRQDRKKTPRVDDGDENEAQGAFVNLPKTVEYFAMAIAPMLLPTINALGDLEEDRSVVPVDDSGEAA